MAATHATQCPQFLHFTTNMSTNSYSQLAVKHVIKRWQYYHPSMLLIRLETELRDTKHHN